MVASKAADCKAEKARSYACGVGNALECHKIRQPFGNHESQPTHDRSQASGSNEDAPEDTALRRSAKRSDGSSQSNTQSSALNLYRHSNDAIAKGEWQRTWDVRLCDPTTLSDWPNHLELDYPLLDTDR